MFRSAAFWAVTVFLCCTGARATGEPPKDPIIIIAGGDDAEPSFPLGSTFSIVSPTGTSPSSLKDGSPCEIAGIQLPLCLFSNGTDSTWSTLTFSITPGYQLGPFTCLALAHFSQCNFSDHNQKVTFAGGKGIAAGDQFLFSVVLWLPNTAFSGKATGTESGIGALRRPVPPRAPSPGSRPSTTELFLDGQVALRDRSSPRVAAGSGV